MLYGVGRMDASGRISERHIIQALNWKPGQCLDIAIVAHGIVVRSSTDGLIVLPRSQRLTIPVSARRHCNIESGDHLLLAAAPEHGIVIVHTAAALDDMLVQYHTSSPSQAAMSNGDATGGPNRIDEIAAARLLLAKLGVAPNDLLDTAAVQSTGPTFAEYVPLVSQAVSAGTRRAYSTYWNRVVAAWGSRQLTEVTALEISQLAEHIKTIAVQRQNTRGGRSAAEHTISALRCLYKHAVADEILADVDNPAKRVPKPRRLPNTRQALPNNRLDEINHAAATTGNDPALDTLLIRLHVETACRRGGALALSPSDLDEQQCLIQLHEKGGTTRWQPVSPTLMAHLMGHGDTRGGLDSDRQLLRYASGRPITARRYDHLWQRLGHHLPWVAIQQVSTHWLRHTTLTWVERNFGCAVAHAFAGHTDHAKDRNSTTTYIRATLYEVATALAALTGEPHPLAASSTGVSSVDDVADLSSKTTSDCPPWTRFPAGAPTASLLL